MEISVWRVAPPGIGAQDVTQHEPAPRSDWHPDHGFCTLELTHFGCVDLLGYCIRRADRVPLIGHGWDAGWGGRRWGEGNIGGAIAPGEISDGFLPAQL